MRPVLRAGHDTACLLWAFALCVGCSGEPADHGEPDAAPADSGARDATAQDVDDAGPMDSGSGFEQPPPSRVCSRDGFCWESPTPQGETLRAAWAAAPDDVWLAADGGGLLHFDGRGFRAEYSDDEHNLLAIHGTAANDVWAVGEGGRVAHYDGERWTVQNLSSLIDASGGGMTGVLYGVYAAAKDAVWAVGHSGVGAIVIYFDGNEWSSQPLAMPSDTALRAIWGLGRDKIWAVGDKGVIRSFDGTQWKADKSPTSAALLSVHTLAAHDVWAVGAAGVAVHWNGTQWSNANAGLSGVLQSVRVDIAAPMPVADAGMAGMPAPPADAGTDAGDAALPKAPEGPWSVWAFGDMGHVFRYNGTLWDALPSGTSLTFNAATRLSEGTLLAVGQRGQITRFAGDSRQPLSSETRNNHLALWGDGTTLWAVGDAIERRDSSGWNALMRISERSLYGVWGDQSGLWAVGTAGSIVRYQNDAWKMLDNTAAGDAWLHGIGGAGHSLWIVGDGGLALTAAAGGWLKVATPARSNLLDVWGQNDDAFWAVGEGGTVLRWDGNAWLKVPTGPMGGTAQTLRAVWGTGADDVWVVGTEATLLHWNGERFETHSRDAHYALNDVWGSGRDDVYAVGSGGVALHYDGNAWQELDTGTRSALQSVFGDAHGRVFFAGLDGVLLVREPQ